MSLGAIASNRRRRRVPLNNGGLPRFLDGLGNVVTAPFVGQKLFPDVGGWAPAPTSYAWQVYDDSGPVLDGYGTEATSGEQFYIVYDAELAFTLRLGVIASNLAGPSLEALSVATAAVVDRAIAKPTLARTTPSGTVPMGFRIDLPAGVLVGDKVRPRVYSNATLGDDVKLQDVYHVLTEADLQAPFTPNWADAIPTGLVAPGATDYMTVIIEGRSPQGRNYRSPLSDAISPTDAVLPATFDPIQSTAALSGGGLTAEATGGGLEFAICNRAAGAGQLFHFEQHVDAKGAAWALCLLDASAPLNPGVWPGDGGDQHGFSFVSDGSVYINGASTAGSPGFATGVTLACSGIVDGDGVGATVWVSIDGVQANGSPGTSADGFATRTGGFRINNIQGCIPAFGGIFGDEICTANFAGPFLHQPAGYPAL